MREYQAMFIFSDKFNEEELENAQEQAKGEIEKLGGKISHIEKMGRRSFARTMKKRDGGFYVRMDMDFDPQQIEALNQRYALTESVFRVQICRTPEIPPDEPNKPVEAA
ncbi:MAG: 30S ribosomal protein S6 [Verrucomicrobia bacterium]|nr:30S ribosomal protein S6 [Verrucomicrobiota bacterium]MDA1087951.1 30S ribosomal protein S6 [Verrucomicrobiota bacterium]